MQAGFGSSDQSLACLRTLDSSPSWRQLALPFHLRSSLNLRGLQHFLFQRSAYTLPRGVGQRLSKSSNIFSHVPEPGITIRYFADLPASYVSPERGCVIDQPQHDDWSIMCNRACGDLKFDSTANFSDWRIALG